MAAQGFLLLASYLLVLLVLARPLGMCLARMVNDIPLPGLAGVERVLWRVAGIRAEEMGWLQYLLAILLFNALGGLALFALLMLQGVLPFNPQHLPGLSWDLALNTAISFVSNTNWQAYAGESTMSYLSQMVGLTVQNFLSAATGIAVVFALTRAFARQKMSTLGNAWVDLTRITLWLLLPLSLLVALFFIQQGVPQNLQAYQPFTTLEGVHQLLPMGPVASQEAIKLLGTNGGGFFNANSAHPFENPTALTNLVQMLAIFLIPAALCFAFGEVVSDRRQGRAILWAMTLIFILCVAVVMWAETRGNPHLLTLGADSSLNMEGKESRFGILASSLFAVITTAASCGAVNAMHDSFTALGGMVPMWLMQIGEVVFGGVGSGLYGMLLFVMLAVFIAGLMVGRTPEYLGKKIDVREMKMIALAILVTPTLVLLGTALAMMTDAGRAGMFNPGPHGFSEVLYAVTSAANNNGSAFAGLGAATPFWNLLLAFCMLVGRFAVIIPVMAIAGSLVAKKIQPASPGTLATHDALFIGLLIGTVLLVGALTLVFLLATATIWPFSAWSGNAVSVTVLVALLVCLIPTTIGGLLSAIGVAGMSRMLGANVIATSGRAVEAAGDVDVLLLDKTGTITLGNRQASAFLPARGVEERTLADAAQLSSLADETPEGRSIVVLAKQRFNLRERDLQSLHATFVPFTAQTRMSGINIDQRMIRKGSVDAIRRHVEANGGHFPADVDKQVEEVARQGATPLVVAEGEKVLGIIALKDIVKGGIKERFAQLRKMGIKTVMITGDNRLTAAAIAAEAGVDDFLAEATPEAKLALIRQYQSEGRLVAMTGDGTNDAPALAQADVAVAMNSGTQAAKEAGNMVDLDSNPTKLIEVVHIGKQMLMTRGSLTTFSIANDVAKYFAIIPAAFAAVYPQLAMLNVMGLHSPSSAILSAVIFNALIIVFLIPLALKGVSYRPLSASAMLRRNLWIYGLGGLLVPFIGIKAIDLLLTLSGLV